MKSCVGFTQRVNKTLSILMNDSNLTDELTDRFVLVVSVSDKFTGEYCFVFVNF